MTKQTQNTFASKEVLTLIQNFLDRSSFKATMDMYGRISIDEMQVDAVRKLEVT